MAAAAGMRPDMGLFELSDYRKKTQLANLSGKSFLRLSTRGKGEGSPRPVEGMGLSLLFLE